MTNEAECSSRTSPSSSTVYTTAGDIQNPRKLAELASFCRMMGRDGRQGEIGLVIGDEYLAIRDFAGE